MVNIGFLSLDIIILIGLLLVLFFYSYKTDKKVITTMILTFYPSLLVFQNLPYIDLEEGNPKAIGFLVVYIIVFAVMVKSIHVRRNLDTTRQIIDCFLLSAAFIALLISISAHSVPALQNLYNFTGEIPKQIIKINYGLMLILPLIAVFISNKSRTN